MPWYYSYLPVVLAGAGKGEWCLQLRLEGDLAFRSSGSSPSADPFLFCLVGVEVLEGMSLITPKKRDVTIITQCCSKKLQSKANLRFHKGIIWKFFISLNWQLWGVLVLIQLWKIFALHVRFADFFLKLRFDITHTLNFIFLAVVRKENVQTYIEYNKIMYDAKK